MDNGEAVSYKDKYKNLKNKLKLLLYEQEFFLEELRKTQRKLLKASRDRSVLLDRLLQYEDGNDSGEDTDNSASEDTEEEKQGLPAKRKRPTKTSAKRSQLPSNAANYAAFASSSRVKNNPSSEPTKKKAKLGKKSTKKSTRSGTSGRSKPVPSSSIQGKPVSPSPRSVGDPTREEIERHLDRRHVPQFMILEKTPYSLPDDIFNNDNSNLDSSDVGDLGNTDDQDLIIDLQD